MRGALCLVLAAVLLGATPAAAQEPVRLALLIGNQGYTDKVGALKNPHKDVAAVGKALESVGFKVTSLRDASRRQVLSAVKTLAAQLARAGPSAVGFFYYSGHGVSHPHEKANYLIPIDLKDTDTADFWIDAVKLDDILGDLERAAPFAAHFIVFDACRNELKLPDKSAVKGFEPVAERSGMFIAFATALGAVASDRGEASGPYAGALAAELVKPGQDHLQLFQNVKEGVFSATGRRQVPWERNGLLRRVYFGGEAAAAKPPPSQPPPPQPSEAERAWSLVKDTNNVSILEDFVKRYGETFYGTLARERLAELKKQQVAVATPPPAPKTDPPRPAVAISPPPPTRCDGVEALVSNERRCLKPKDSFKDCPDCPEMVVIPAGDFMMGSPAGEVGRGSDEGPQHRVTIGKSFAVGKIELTFAEWEGCVSAGGCTHKPDDRGWGKGKQPVISVSWYFAKEYGEWLSNKTAKPYRLLTEAEWEYAARAGTSTPFSTGPRISTDQANFDARSGSFKGQYRLQTVEGGSFKPNAFGLYDMHGNVWEWVEDCYKDSYVGAPVDGSAVISGDCSRRVARGGSWFNLAGDVRVAARFSNSADFRNFNIGFRVARTL